jgi:hypothetical protein
MDVVMIRELSFGPLIVKDTSGKMISDTVNVPVKTDKSMMSPELAPCIADFKDSVDRVVGVIVSADRDTVAMVDNPTTRVRRWMSLFVIGCSIYKIRFINLLTYSLPQWQEFRQ